MGLRSRILMAVVCATSLISLFLCFYITEQVRTLELQSLLIRVDKAAYMMRLVNASPLYNVDKETLKINMETFFDDENMKSISIQETDIDFDMFLEREFEPNGMDILKEFYIYHKGLKLGKMRVVYSTSLIEKKLEGFRTQMLYFTFAVILALVLTLVLLINTLMRPVIQLAKVAAEITAGNLEKEIEQDGVGEIGELSRNFARMRDAIQDKINDLALTNQNLENEILQKEINEKKIIHQSAVISSVNTFFQKSMLAHSCQEIAQLFIPIALAVVPSRYCFVGEVNQDNPGQMNILAISDKALADCTRSTMEKKVRVLGKEITGIRSRIIHENVSMISNNPAAHPDFVTLPDNHVPVDSFLGVPMGLGAQTKGIVAFAGKENGYDSGDKESAEILAMALVEALSLKKKEDEKQRLEEMMVHSEKMISLGGLAAGMAHEINNPLAGILQNAQVIKNRLEKRLPANLSAAQDIGIRFEDLQAYMERRGIYKMIDFTLEAGKRAAAIVSNMLSFSRKNGSSFSLEDCGSLLDKTLEIAETDYNLKKKFDFKKILIRKEYGKGLPRVYCKASELQQVFFNILSNGAQAMMSSQMTEPACFDLQIFQEEAMVCVKIQDNGPGMTPEIQKRVFEPFFTTKKAGEGTGLGLAISYFIVREITRAGSNWIPVPARAPVFSSRFPLTQKNSSPGISGLVFSIKANPTARKDPEGDKNSIFLHLLQGERGYALEIAELLGRENLD